MTAEAENIMPLFGSARQARAYLQGLEAAGDDDRAGRPFLIFHGADGFSRGYRESAEAIRAKWSAEEGRRFCAQMSQEALSRAGKR